MPSAYANEELWVKMPHTHPNKTLHLFNEDILPFVAACPLNGHDKTISQDGESVNVSTVPVTITRFPKRISQQCVWYVGKAKEPTDVAFAEADVKVR